MNTTSHTKLTTGDLLALERDSWIDAATAEAFALSRVSSTEGAELVGRTDHEDYAGLVFPIYAPGEARPKEYILRRDHPPLEMQNGKSKPKGKYLFPPGRGNRLFFGPSEPVEALTDIRLPILLVEGVKKTVAAWRLSRQEDGTAPAFLACGLAGVWGWKGTIGKQSDATGARVEVKGVIADVDRVTWTGRTVYVLFDSDTTTNAQVAAARGMLMAELETRGATVTAPDLPALEERDKTGFDDLLAHWGPKRVLEWLATVQETPAPALIPLDEITPPDLPLDAFPETFRDMIAAVAQATETPLEVASMIGLATVATCCQKLFVVEGGPGYTEPLCLWTLAALESGNRKSAVVSMMMAPLVHHEQALQTDGQADRTAQASTRLTAEARIKALRTKVATCPDSAKRATLQDEIVKAELAMPPMPRTPRLVAQDVTPEQLAVLMSENDEALALLSDEGGLFEMMGGRYSNGIPNLDVYLQGHAGTAVRIDRKIGPSVSLNRPALTIGLSPQPSVLQSLTAHEGFRSRGLLARFLYALPPSRLGYRSGNTIPVPLAVTTAYATMCRTLLSLAPTRDTAGRIIQTVLQLTPEAQAEWKAYRQVVEGHLLPGGAFESLKDWAGKLPGAVLRVAGLFHCMTHAHHTPQTQAISLATMNQALCVLSVLATHTRAVFDLMGSDPDLAGARRVMRWAQFEQQDRFSARDCFNALRGTYPKAVQLEPFFKILVERGQLVPMRAIRSGLGRPPSQRYTVHPDLMKGWPV